MQAELVGISLAAEENQAYYIPVGHRNDSGTQLPVARVIDGLTPFMTNRKIKKIGHNLKYDFVVLSRYGLQVSPLSFDSMIADWLLDPSSRNLGLKKSGMGTS